MVRRILVAIAILVLGPAALWAKERAPSPGNPPTILLAMEIDAQQQLVLVEYRTIFIQPGPSGGGGPRDNDRSLKKVSLKGVKIYTSDGKEITIEAARKRLGAKQTAILATSWGKQLPDLYRPLFKDDVLLFAFSDEAPTWQTIQVPEMPVNN